MQWNFRLLWRGLKDIYKRKIKGAEREAAYPSNILPKKNYIVPININKLNQVNDYVIIRRSEKSAEETFNELGNLKEDILLDKSVPGMSMNLLGGFFKSNHIKFVPKGLGMKDWDGIRKIRLKDYLENINILETCSPIFFLIKEVQNFEFPYSRPSDKHAKALLTALNQEVGSDGKFHLIAKTEIRHKPSNLNYWHVEFTILELNSGKGNIIDDTGSNWKKSLVGNSILHYLSVKANQEQPSIPLIRKKNYHKIYNYIYNVMS